jgi:hypothetical protein
VIHAAGAIASITTEEDNAPTTSQGSATRKRRIQ